MLVLPYALIFDLGFLLAVLHFQVIIMSVAAAKTTKVQNAVGSNRTSASGNERSFQVDSTVSLCILFSLDDSKY